MVRIPESCVDGDDYKIKITDNYDDTEFDFRAPFTIQQRKITVLFPMESDELVPFTTFTIGWTSLGVSPSAKLRIDLFLNSTHIHEISNQTENDGIFKWRVLTGVDLINHTYSHYQIRIQDSETQKYIGLSPFFTITKEKFMKITSPVNNNSFTQGKKMNIIWETDSTSYKVNINLMRGNTVIYDIEPVRNKGSYDWIIPLTIRPGTDYYIFINATDNSASTISHMFIIKPKLKGMAGYNFPLFLIIIILGVAVIWNKIIKTKASRLP
jgi:hypothetical protein